MRIFPAAIAALLFAGAALPAGAQMMTERYVPIGRSPGVSGERSTIGHIVRVDRDARTMTVENDAGQRTYRVTDNTHIWLDRSRWRLSNVDGSYRDCSVGQRVEVLQRRDDENLADWIKVEAQAAR